jgi:hypothetical protein
MCAASFCLVITLTLVMAGLGSSLFNGDCRGRPPFVRPQHASHAVFTAKVLYAGRSLRTAIYCSSLFGSGPVACVTDPEAGEWAIGVIADRFWGMPRWTRLVLLTNHIYWKGETYFVDGMRSYGMLASLLPIVEGGIHCSRTRPIQSAVADMRLLRNPPPANGTRVIGCVVAPRAFKSGMVRPVAPVFVAGARVNVTGKTFSRTVITDASGVYELDDLAPGEYTLDLPVPDTQAVGFFDQEGSPAHIVVQTGTPVERNFEVFWNGRVEGRVVDRSGESAHTWVYLVPEDGSILPGNVRSLQMTASDGSYQFRKIPPGLYRVVVNLSGPRRDWPYDMQYHPQALKLGAGQRVTGVDFMAPRLSARKIQVRVTWESGAPAASAQVYLGYEHTEGYLKSGREAFSTTDSDGISTIETYGRSHVRISAALGDWSSRPVLFPADQVPERLDVILLGTKK